MACFGISFVITLWCSLISGAFSLDCDPSVKITIPGSGSSIASGFLSDVAASFTANRSLTVGLQLSITQESNNAGQGMDRLLGKRPPDTPDGPSNVLWACGETFFLNDVNPYPGNVYQIPVLGEGMTIYYNLPDANGTLNLTIDMVAKIYMGQLSLWNDSSIQNINPNSKMPDANIIVIARKDDNTAHTRYFTSYLAKNSYEWNSKYGEFNSPNFTGPKSSQISLNYPKGVIDYWANYAFGMMDLAVTIPYSIGWGSYNDAMLGKITFANMKHPNSNNFVTCNTDSIREAANYFISTKPNETTFRLMDAAAPKAWPMSTFHYLGISLATMANYRYSILCVQPVQASITAFIYLDDGRTCTSSCCQRRELVGYLDFMLFMPQVESAALKYSFISLVSTSLPPKIANTVLSLVNCDGENMYDSYRESLAPAYELLPWQSGLIALAVIIFVGLVGLAGFFWHRTALMHERNWLIPARLLNLNALVAGQSMSSVNTSGSSPKLQSSTASKESGLRGRIVTTQFPNARTTMEDKLVMVADMDAPLPRHWRKETKMIMFRLCQRITHVSVGHFYGVTVIGTRVFAVEEFLGKGTLHYALSSSRFEFTETIKVSMAGDVAEGMGYLHSRGVVHGLLNSLTCFVSSSWAIKVCDWMLTCVMTNENNTAVDHLYKFSKEEMKDERRLIQLLYLHPGAMKAGKFSQQSDVFGFGMLIYEILNRCTPYTHEVMEQKKTTFYQVVKTKTDLQFVNPPDVTTAQTSVNLEKLGKQCLAEKQTNFVSIISELQAEQFHGSITDILMESMEGMITDLEKKTADLNKVSARMRELLNQVLPQAIAEKLAAGQTVDPEYFESVSVFFSDIVGFTTISSQSSPLEVMTFLNDLWIAFDAVIEQFDCYKVDTIGDAYMVCSGLPTRNGIMHVKHIVDLALSLLRKSAGFVIRHMFGETLKIRVGINTGPVTAGVVGTKMPQYCVFGDTVNTANRMESTGLPGKIQVSDITARMLTANFPQYKVERRGDIEVKGKGLMSTFWLEEPPGLYQNISKALPSKPPVAYEPPIPVIHAIDN